MLIPALTVFNPFFVDLFLRYNYPDVLWRLCYLIPLPFAGAFVVVHYLDRLRKAQGVTQKLKPALILFGLAALLLPVSTTYFVSPYSRIYTLQSVGDRNGHKLWRDLHEFLGTLEPRDVLTDQVTGYTINALTKHRYRGHKFYGTGAPKIKRANYDKATFEPYDGWLLIVNKRDGRRSDTGRVSKHWPENILKVSRHYPAVLEDFIQREPEMFTKLWEHNQISVYEINVVGG